MKRILLSVMLLLIGTCGQAHAQRAGLWEVQVTADGITHGAPIRECRAAGAQLAALQAWPANCAAEPLRRTASGMVSKASCASGRAGSFLHIRYELAGDLDRRFQIVTTSWIDAATSRVDPGHRTTATFRYLGSCSAGGLGPADSERSAYVPASQESLPAIILRIMTPLLTLCSIAAVAWFLRRRWRDQGDRATVTDIATDAAGAATIPVRATFCGVRGLPWWYGIATNNASPLLIIELDAIRFRVIRQQRRSFADIACVDVRQAPGTVNVDFAFHGSVLTFAANVGTVALAERVIASLPPGVPLTSRAQALKTLA